MACICCGTRPSYKRFKFIHAFAIPADSDIDTTTVKEWNKKRWRAVGECEVGVCRRCVMVYRINGLLGFLLLPPLFLLVGLTIIDAGRFVGGRTELTLWPDPPGFEPSCLAIIPEVILTCIGFLLSFGVFIIPLVYISNAITMPFGFVADKAPGTTDIACPSFIFGAKALAHASALEHVLPPLIDPDVDEYYRLFCAKLWTRLSDT